MLSQTMVSEPRRLVVRTRDMDESALLLLTLVKTVGAAAASQRSADWVVAPPPPRRCTGSVYLRQLCCVDGVSPARAQTIARSHPTMPELVDAVRKDPDAVATALGQALRNAPLGRRVVDALLDGGPRSGSRHAAHTTTAATHQRKKRKLIEPTP